MCDILITVNPSTTALFRCVGHRLRSEPKSGYAEGSQKGGGFTQFNSRLPKFKPIRLEKLLKDSKIDEATVLELRSKINRQQSELLAAIGLDPDTPKVWERAFFCLARIHHGVGLVSFTPKKPSMRQAATWTSEHRRRFYEMMLELQDAGLNEHQAVKKIASDPARYSKFPHKSQNRPSSSSSEAAKREKAFWRRWIMSIKGATSPRRNLLRAVASDYPIRGNAKAQREWLMELLASLPPVR